jgi:hypothetical protein
MTWGIENHVIERFAGAGIPAENISFVKDTFTFNFTGTPAEFLNVCHEWTMFFFFNRYACHGFVFPFFAVIDTGRIEFGFAVDRIVPRREDTEPGRGVSD